MKRNFCLFFIPKVKKSSMIMLWQLIEKDDRDLFTLTLAGQVFSRKGMSNGTKSCTPLDEAKLNFIKDLCFSFIHTTVEHWEFIKKKFYSKCADIRSRMMKGKWKLLTYVSNHRELYSGIVLLTILLDFGYGSVKYNTNVLSLYVYILSLYYSRFAKNQLMHLITVVTVCSIPGIRS